MAVMPPMNSADVTARLARNVHRVRLERGWTQEQMGEQFASPVANNTISMWERGVRRIGEGHLLELAELTERDLAWFYSDHDDDEPSA
jgi:transcriptional regulator with XRE-family HTH domain